MGTKEPFALGTNAYAQLLMDVPVEDGNYEAVMSSTLDTMFVTCNMGQQTAKDKARNKETRNNKHNVSTTTSQHTATGLKLSIVYLL